MTNMEKMLNLLKEKRRSIIFNNKVRTNYLNKEINKIEEIEVISYESGSKKYTKKEWKNLELICNLVLFENKYGNYNGCFYKYQIDKEEDKILIFINENLYVCDNNKENIKIVNLFLREGF